MMPINVPSSGLWAYQNRVGTITKQNGHFIFTAIDNGNRFYTAILTEEPEWLGTDWISVGEYFKNSRWTKERWSRDYHEFLRVVVDLVEERILDDDISDDVFEKVASYDDDRDETHLQWGTPDMKDIIYAVIKDEVSNFDWYKDDNALDRALGYLQFLCFDIDCSDCRNWNDFKRVYFLKVLQALCHQNILDKHGIEVVSFN
jgi:hypothetical protein